MYNKNYQAHLEAASTAIAKDPKHVPTPFLFDAQMSYTASTSEWRQLISVKAHVMKHGNRSIIEAFTKREEALRKAHALELQVFFSLGVVASTVGAIPVYPFDEDFQKVFIEAYHAGLNSTYHELGLVGNVAAYRDLCEDTMPVCSIVTLAASHINTLGTEFNKHVWGAADHEDGEIDSILVDELHRKLRIWCGLLVLRPDEYPSIGFAVAQESLPEAIGEDILEYFKNSKEVLAHVFLPAANAEMAAERVALLAE